jgi:hypothetical protein
VTYLVFDAPAHGGKYEERVKWLKENIKAEKVLSSVLPETDYSRSALFLFSHTVSASYLNDWAMI